MRTFLATLLICSVSMSALTLLYLAGLPLLKKRYQGKGLYYAWLVIVIGFIIPFRPAFENPVIRISLPAPCETAAPESMTPTIRLQSDILLLENNCYIEPDFIHSNSIHAGVPWETIAVLVWMTGMITLLAFHIAKHRRFVCAVRRWGEDITNEQTLACWKAAKAEAGITRPIRLQQCDFISSPLLSGVFYPRILLPKRTIPGSDLSYILKHELIHFKRKDLWYKGMVLLSTAIHWFNPIVYIMAKTINTFCERSCDDDVIRGADTAMRREYIKMLEGAIGRCEPLTSLSTHLYGGKKAMKNRIASIMDSSQKRRGIIVLCAILLAAAITGVAIAASPNDLPGAPEALWPTAPGTEAVKNTNGWIDYSNTSDGYITVAYTGGSGKRAKCRIEKILFGKSADKPLLLCDLPGDGTPVVLPLTDGDGKYLVSVYQQINGNNYGLIVRLEQNVSLRTEYAPFLYPTQLMNYTQSSQCVKIAAELCRNAGNDAARFSAIYAYVIENIRFDRELAESVQSGYIPDPDRTLESGLGLPFDYASLMGAMLRSQGIPARMITGHVSYANNDNTQYHAWNEVYLEEEGWILADAFHGAIPRNADMSIWSQEPALYTEIRRD